MAHLHAIEYGKTTNSKDGAEPAPTLVLLSSIGTTHDSWAKQIPVLAEQFHVVTVDHRGHGESETPTTPPSDVAELGRDVLAALDAIGVERFNVVGLSLGGAIAQWLAAESGRVDKAVFCCTATFLGGKEKWDERTSIARTQGTQALADGMMENWFTEDFRRAHADEVRAVHTMVCTIDDEGYAQNGDALSSWDFESELAKVTCPVLTIAGASDPGTPPRELEKIARAVSGPSQSVVIEPGSHQVAIENPIAFNEVLTQFFTD